MMSSPASRNEPSPLPKILQVTVALAILLGLGALVLRGAGIEDLLLAAAAVALPVYLLAMSDPILGIAITIACIGFSPELTIGSVRNLRVEDFVVPGLLLGWLLRAGRDRTPLAKTHLWGPTVLALLAISLSTIAGSVFKTAPFFFALMIVGKYLEYLAIYIVIVNLVKTEGEIRALGIFSILVAVGTTFLNVGSSISEATSDAIERVQGPLGETANIYGAYVGMNLLLALGLFLHAPSGSGRIVTGAAVVVLGICILFTYSRASYVAVAGAILIYGAFKSRRLLLILALLAVVLPTLAPRTVLDRMATVGGVAAGPDPSSWAARLEAWEMAWNRMSAPDLVFGNGIYSIAFGDVDSEYVRILVDTGFVGLALAALIQFRLGRLAYRTHEALGEYTFAKGYMAGYLMLFLSMLIHAIAATTFSAIRSMETFMVLSGLMTALANLQEDAAPAEPGRPVVLLADAPVLEPQRR